MPALFDIEVHSRTCQVLHLPSGRDLGFAEYGSNSVDAPVILYCHGWPGSRLEAGYFHSVALARGIKIIGIDRPGIGMSTTPASVQCCPWPRIFTSARSITDWPEDARRVLDALHVRQFYILGYSGGSGYALACAKMMDPSRILGVGIISGMAPWKIARHTLDSTTRTMIRIVKHAPFFTTTCLLSERKTVANCKDPSFFDRAIEAGIAKMTAKEKLMFQEEGEIKNGFKNAYKENLKEAYRGDTGSLVRDLRLIVSDWGFSLEGFTRRSISSSSLNDEANDELLGYQFKLYHGTQDINVPIAQSIEMQKRLPKGTILHEFTGETHFTIIPRHGGQILDDLVRRP